MDSFIFSGVDANEFWKEIMIFFISMEECDKFNFDLINGISIINKNN